MVLPIKIHQNQGLCAECRMYRGRHQCTPVQQQRQEAAQQQRHAAWVATYEAIHALHAQGTPVTTIAAQLGLSRPTVYRLLRRTTPPPPRSPQRSGQVLRPYMAYLIRRWREGCTDGSALHVMLFLENPIQTLCIFKGLQSHHC